jgi:dimethylhistidine N-methyltransferase
MTRRIPDADLLQSELPSFPAAVGPEAKEQDVAQTLFYCDVVAGLRKRPKSIPCKYFYDDRGSQLFETICRTPEYYLTRTEIEVLTLHGSEIARVLGRDTHLIEFGSGSSSKVRLLLDLAPALASYIAVDISYGYLTRAAATLAKSYPHLRIVPLCADFTKPFVLPTSVRDGRRVGFFPGSTIGNFPPDEARLFLHQAATLLGDNGGLIVGVDLKKDPIILEAAYNDTAGVTAAFNLNLLRRINRELQGTFDLRNFAHRAIYNAKAGRIEMYIDSTTRQGVRLGDHGFTLEAGEPIHTENSYKYTVEEFQVLARSAGFVPVEAWTDHRKLFSVHYLRTA